MFDNPLMWRMIEYSISMVEVIMLFGFVLLIGIPKKSTARFKIIATIPPILFLCMTNIPAVKTVLGKFEFVFTTAYLALYALLFCKESKYVKVMSAVMARTITSLTVTLSLYFVSAITNGYNISALLLVQNSNRVFHLLLSKTLYFLTAILVIRYYRTFKRKKLILKPSYWLYFSFLYFMITVASDNFFYMTLSKIVTIEEPFSIFLFELLIWVIAISIGFMLFMVSKSNKEAVSKIVATQKRTFEKDVIIEISEKLRKMEMLREDVISNLTPVVHALYEFEYDEARKFVMDICTDLSILKKSTSYSENPILNSMLNKKIYECKTRRIKVDADVRLSQEVCYSDCFNLLDLSLLIGILFDTIMIASDQVENEKGNINCSIFSDDVCIIIELKSNIKRWYNERLKSTMEENVLYHFDLVRIEKELEKYGGNLMRNDSETICYKVCLPLKEKVRKWQ